MPKEWADRQSDPDVLEDYSIIQLYTTEYGYRQIFRIINDAFRRDELMANTTYLRSAVFLVELMNIELFNHLISVSSPGFTGIAYRGLCFSPRQLEHFKALTSKPVQERYWAILLALMSCTLSETKAVCTTRSRIGRKLEGARSLEDSCCRSGLCTS